MNKSLKILLITAFTFSVYFVLDDLFFRGLRTWIDSYINQLGISHIITYIISGIPIVIGAILLHKPKNLFKSLGLNKSIATALVFALICTFPMLIGFAIVFNFNPELTFNGILISAVSAAFFEEVIYRGFLYGQLYRYTKFGFVPSVVLGALVFASVHLYQSDDFMTLVGIFTTTLLGAIIFAWVYSEWEHNIWAPIFLHFFMNLFWMLFTAGDNALGGLYANIFRISTIILIIVLTIAYKNKKGLGLEINRATFWMKKNSNS